MLTAALIGVLMLQGPTPVPAAGASPAQQPKVTKAEEQHQKDVDADIALGKKFVIEVEKTEKISDNKEYLARVERIGQELAAISRDNKVEVRWGDGRLSKFNYTFKILKGNDVNAFSLPGGFIYVYEGLVKYAESDDEIAAVLAHEISHAEQRHINKLTKETSKIQTPALIAILGAIATGNPDLIRTAIILGTNTVQAFTSTWSVDAEESADHGGFQYLIKSKYNGTAMLTFMERLALDDHNDPVRNLDWGIYRTHPPGRERASAILADMARYNVPVERSAVTTRFRTDVRAGKEGTEIWFNKQRLYVFGGPEAAARAQEAAGKLDRFFDREPNLFDVSFDGKDILGKRSPLIEVRAEDAALGKKTTDAVGTETLRAIRGSLYNYAFNVWGTK